MQASTLACLVALSTGCTAIGFDSSSCPAIPGSGGSAGIGDFLIKDSSDALSLLQYRALHIHQGATLMRLHTPDPETGIWEAEDLEGRRDGGLNSCVADHLLQLMDELKFASVLDLGAGSGAYSMYLEDRLNGEDVQCCDGNPAIVNTSHGLCSVCDLSSPQVDMKQADLVFSLEVAEHIPRDSEMNFLHNIQSKTKQLLVLSWGIPGQVGNGHVNCRSNEYAIQKMKETGFAYCSGITNSIRDAVSSPSCIYQMNSGNFWNTLMVFNKGDSCQLSR